MLSTPNIFLLVLYQILGLQQGKCTIEGSFIASIISVLFNLNQILYSIFFSKLSIFPNKYIPYLSGNNQTF